MGNKIQFFVMDVDGTLTDGRIYMGGEGELCKAFHVQDGYGIKELLSLHEIIPIVITARSSRIVERRCQELCIPHLYQGVSQKQPVLDAVLEQYARERGEQYTYQNVAYIGDDIPDLNCMAPIRAAGGLIGCPQNAVSEVKQIAHYICRHAGGDGAVREFIEWLLRRGSHGPD